MHVCVGYRVEDRDVPKSLNKPHETLKLTFMEKGEECGDRKAMSACIGPCVRAGGNSQPVARPRVDRNDPVTTLTGIIKRFALKPPELDPKRMESLTSFVADWLEHNLDPISCDEDYEFEFWIDRTNYSLARRDELRILYEGLTSTPEKREFLVKMFVKDEGYDDWKHSRGINSRSDEFKCRVGPIFKLIEKEVFKLPCFIKKVPISERSDYIVDMLGETGPFLVSDYTAFESLFTFEVMKAVEMQLYEHMTKYLPNWWYDLVSKVLLGVNVCQSKHLCIKLLCKRMSGEMCTSLGNGFSNWMFINFVCKEMGTKVTGVVEGDDGLFKLEGTIPTISDFETLGLVVKLEVHKTIGTTSFCGMLFHEDACDVVTDPKKVLAEFGWFHTRYSRAKPSVRKMLLRAKSNSLRAQYPNCPIIRALSDYGLRMTKSYSSNSKVVLDSMDTYKREQYLRLLSVKVAEPNIHVASRILVEQEFGIDIAEQLRLEDYFHGLNDWHWDLPVAPELFPEAWRTYGEDYVVKSTGASVYPMYTPMKNKPEMFPEIVRPHLAKP